MGALPKRKVSQVRRGNRRSHDAIGKLNLIPCPNCHELHPQHQICPSCGYYKGVEVIEKKTEKKKKGE